MAQNKAKPITYQKARQKMITKEKILVAKLMNNQSVLHVYEEPYGSQKANDIKEQLVADIMRVTSIVQQKVRTANHTHNGWLRDTEYVRKEFVGGFSSKGKAFTKRLFRLTAIWKFYETITKHSWDGGLDWKGALDFVEMFHTPNEGNFERDFNDDLDFILEQYKWTFNFYSQQAQQKHKEQETKRKHEQQQRRNTSWDRWADWNNHFSGSGNSGWFGENFQGASVSRKDEWAYSRMAAVPKDKTWFAILDVEEKALPKDVKKAFRTLSKAKHPDVAGGSADTFMMISEAYEVYNKIKASNTSS